MRTKILIGSFLLSLFLFLSPHNNQNLSKSKVRKEILLSEAWLIKNTKPCPNCGIPIIKDGGCDYVVCSYCGHGFCYNCFGKHHVSKCKRPSAKPNWKNLHYPLPHLYQVLATE